MRLIFLLLLILPSVSKAQDPIDDIIKSIVFKGDTVKAVFKYVAGNISYNTDFKDAPPEYHSENEVLDDVLEQRSGVCMHYAALFHSIIKRLGYKSYIVNGYTKFMNQPVSLVPHAWNAVKINGEWFLFDPTWASGYVVGNVFYQYYEEMWYKRKPEEFIYSHIPFDPIFQFLSNPVSHFSINNEKYDSEVYLDFENLLHIHDSSDNEKKFLMAINRISNAGVTNSLIENKIKHYHDQLNVIQHNRQVYTYSASIEVLKNARSEYYNYLLAKKKLFKKWDDREIVNHLQSCSSQLSKVQEQLLAIEVADERLQKSIHENMLMARHLQQDLEQEKIFINKFLSTWKPLRIFTFL